MFPGGNNSATNNGVLPPSLREQTNKLQKYKHFIQVRFQKLLDDSTPFLYGRWGFTAFLSIIYILRVSISGGWYIISYALGIYLLNILIAFLSPQVDPESEFDASLPVGKDDEFRPFVRRLPEFKFW